VEDTLSKAQMSTFGQLDSDFRRMGYLQGLEVVQNIAPVPMFRQKNPTEARILMAQAESYLEKGSSSTALNLISRAITQGPWAR